MLPLKLQDPEAGCIRPNDDVYCFDAGDNRVNEQLVSEQKNLLQEVYIKRFDLKINRKFVQIREVPINKIDTTFKIPFYSIKSLKEEYFVIKMAKKICVWCRCLPLYTHF